MNRPGDGCCCICRASVKRKPAALCSRLVADDDPLAALATAEMMALLPAKSKGFYAGFVADVRKIQAANPEHDPAAAIVAVLQGGYPAVVRAVVRSS